MSSATAADSPQLILASLSPRRRELLHQLGLDFLVVPSHAEEQELPGETPEQHVQRLSLEKARQVAARQEIPGRYFLGSDTVVVLDGQVLGKPADAAEAAAMLGALAGRQHQVVSGYAVFDRATGRCEQGAVITQVWFRALTAAEISGYIATGEPMDKAGAYAIQGRAGAFIPRIDGSYSNVVGLPLCETLAALVRIGAVRPAGGEA